jgi:hypothetical protein
MSSEPTIEEILDRHHIPCEFRPAFYEFTEEGEIIDDDFRERLATRINYQAACDEIMELLAKPYSYLFSSAPPFESLDPSDFPLEPLP